MHEFSIASALIENVLEIASQNQAVKVETVEVQAGRLKLIIPAVMQTAWQSVIVDTIAEGSELVITETDAKARCRQCSFEFEPQTDNFLCPKCSLADAEILQGDSLILMSVICKSKNQQENNE